MSTMHQIKGGFILSVPISSTNQPQKYFVMQTPTRRILEYSLKKFEKVEQQIPEDKRKTNDKRTRNNCFHFYDINE